MTGGLWVGHINAHNRTGAVATLLEYGVDLRGRDLDVVGVNEGHRILSWLRDRDGYRLEVVDDSIGNDRGRETPTLTLDRLPTVGSGAFRIARATGPEKVAGLPRVATVSVFDHPDVGIVAHVNVHLHWIGPAHDDPDVDRVRETGRAMRSLALLVCFLRSTGATGVVVTGDVNIPRDTPTPGWLSPWEAFERAGLEARAVGRLDALAWSPGLDLVRVWKLAAGVTGTDHPSFVARFRRSS